MGREQTQTDDQRVLQSLEIILIDASIDNVQKDGRDLRTPGQGILDRGVLGQQLCGQVSVGDIAVVGRELVAVQAEGTDPQLATGIDLASNFLIKKMIVPIRQLDTSRQSAKSTLDRC